MPSEVYSLFSNKISRRGFDHIWRGENWKGLMPEAIEYFHSKKYKTATKKFARENQISKDKKQIYQDIKEKKQKGLKRMDVYEEYKNIYSLSGFNKVWYK